MAKISKSDKPSFQDDLLQHVADTVNYFTNTFKPYKTGYHAKRDFSQPVRGVKNIAKGALMLLIGAPLFFLITLIRDGFRGLITAIMGTHTSDSFVRDMKKNFRQTTLGLLEGILNLVCGVAQFTTTPLTWLIKMPLRGLITAIMGTHKIEQNKGVQRQVEKGKVAAQRIIRLVAEGENGALCDAAHSDLDNACDQLDWRFVKNACRGQKTKIPSADRQQWVLFAETKKFRYDAQDNELPQTAETRQKRAEIALQYIGLFSLDAEEQQQSIEAMQAQVTRLRGK